MLLDFYNRSLYCIEMESLILKVRVSVVDGSCGGPKDYGVKETLVTV